MSDFKKTTVEIWKEIHNEIRGISNTNLTGTEKWFRADFVKNVLFIAEYELNNTTEYACWEEALQDIRKALGLLDDAQSGEGQPSEELLEVNSLGSLASEVPSKTDVSRLPTKKISFKLRNEPGLHCRFCDQEYGYMLTGDLYETFPIKGIVCNHCRDHLLSYLGCALEEDTLEPINSSSLEKSKVEHSSSEPQKIITKGENNGKRN
jgi:hypothetical protein